MRLLTVSSQGAWHLYSCLSGSPIKKGITAKCKLEKANYNACKKGWTTKRRKENN